MLFLDIIGFASVILLAFSILLQIMKEEKNREAIAQLCEAKQAAQKELKKEAILMLLENPVLGNIDDMPVLFACEIEDPFRGVA